MTSITFKLMSISSAILFIAIGAGWLLARKVVDDKAGFQIFRFAVLVSSLLFIIKIFIYYKSRKNPCYILLFKCSIGVDLAWLLTCCFLPYFWIDYVNKLIKCTVLVLYIYICIANMHFATKNFLEKWRSLCAVEFERNFKYSGGSIDWENFAKSLNFTVGIFVPHIPEKFDEIMSVIIVGSALLALALRGSHPALSMFALGVPCSLGAACCLQISVYYFLQARQFGLYRKQQ